MRGFAKFDHVWLEVFIPQLPAREGIILYLESRKGVNQKHDFGRLMTATKKSARTLERAIEQMVKDGELVVKDDHYFVAKTADISADKHSDKDADKVEARTPTNMGTKMATEAPTNLSKIATENAVLDEETDTRKKLVEGKEGKEVVTTKETPLPPKGVLETSSKEKPAKISKPKAQPAPLELPEWLPQAVWDEWIAYRKECKLPCASSVLKAQITVLGGFFEQGMDVQKIIKTSISSGWKGLFPDKDFKPRSRGIFSHSSSGMSIQSQKINDEEYWAQIEREENAKRDTLLGVSYG